MENLVVKLEPRFKLGKIVSKYIIIEILGYAFQTHRKVCEHLYFSSKKMRNLLI